MMNGRLSWSENTVRYSHWSEKRENPVFIMAGGIWYAFKTAN